MLSLETLVPIARVATLFLLTLCGTRGRILCAASAVAILAWELVHLP